MNDDDVSFDRVKVYSSAGGTMTINDPNMKGFLFVAGLDINGDAALLTATAIDPFGLTFSIDYVLGAQRNGDPNGDLSGDQVVFGTVCPLGNLIDNTLPFGVVVGNNTPQFFPHVITNVTITYSDVVLTLSTIYTFF